MWQLHRNKLAVHPSSIANAQTPDPVRVCEQPMEHIVQRWKLGIHDRFPYNRSAPCTRERPVPGAPACTGPCLCTRARPYIEANSFITSAAADDESMADGGLPQQARIQKAAKRCKVQLGADRGQGLGTEGCQRAWDNLLPGCFQVRCAKSSRNPEGLCRQHNWLTICRQLVAVTLQDILHPAQWPICLYLL